MRIALLIISLVLFRSCPDTAGDPVDFVNPFIGTAGGGNTFPGAVVPWGMVSVSPHTHLHAPSGYIHGEPWFYGFGHVHLSGTGCSDLGSIIVTATRDLIIPDPEGYKCSYRSEEAKPGYYRIHLNEPAMDAEATAGTHSGIIRFTATQNGTVSLILDAGRSLVERQGGSVRFVTPVEIEGYNRSGGFCGEDNQHSVYFVSRVSVVPQEFGTWAGTRVTQKIKQESENSGVGAWMTFSCDKGQAVIVKTGISYVSIENARENLDHEILDWDFDTVHEKAENIWREQLSRVTVKDGSDEDLTKFYSALYHCLIHPNIISDVNGEYPLMGRSGTGRYTNRERYSVYSLWDTYRTLHPLLTLIYPERQSAMIQTMIDMYDESGFLPKWELAGNETYMMVGDPAPIVIADSYVKGIRDFDVHKALEAVTKPAFLDPGEKAPPIRAGYHELLEYGYIPFEQDMNSDWWVWGPVSTTLEYNLADFCISRLAEEVGDTIIAKTFAERSLTYRNLFDPVTHFIRPKLKNGDWMEPFNPLETEGSGYWEGSGGPGYVEGNAWNYTWFVPHDIPGLMELFGGTNPFAEKLERCFSEDHFTINNEPDIAYPYLFTYAPGFEHRCADYVREIMTNDFGTGPGGLPGNDDAGAISAWFVFSALGFYPDCPAVDDYRLGFPLFDQTVIALNQKYYQGSEIVIEKSDKSKHQTSLFTFQLDGKAVTDWTISHNRLTKGAKLIFTNAEKTLR
ncbi:MAG: alpha-1,2-mannosidase [Marinimicrobia bacterium 46_47]|nr:MAG: alpha-1,2-mannosidase [Marinimicrobia bacterium 46_47]